MYSLEVITPPNNDGSRPRYAFPIKHQVLRCGKWIPTEEMYYNALYLYCYLQQEWMFNVYKDKGMFWHEGKRATIEVDDYGRVRMHETPPSVEEVMENYIAPLPCTKGKLPYVGRERSRKYGNEVLLKELMEKYKLDGPIEILSQGTTAMSDSGTFMEEIRNYANRRTEN